MKKFDLNMNFTKATLALFVATLISGCASQNTYSPDSTKMLVPTRPISNQYAFAIGNFSYSPPSGLGQFDYSNLGCLFCKSDGRTQGGKIEIPIHEKIRAEAKNSIIDAAALSNMSDCEISGEVNMVGYNINGWEEMDITYALKFKQNEIFRKRLKVESELKIFGSPGRFFARVTQISVDELFADSIFTQALAKHCSKN